MKSKMRTKKIVAKRFKVTKNGIILRRRQFGRHLRAAKSRRQIRKFRQPAKVSVAMSKVIRVFLPYS